jgi:uncharacterized lipoprotein YmbA
VADQPILIYSFFVEDASLGLDTNLLGDHDCPGWRRVIASAGQDPKRTQKEHKKQRFDGRPKWREAVVSGNWR